MDDRTLLELAAKASGLDLQHKVMFGGDRDPGYYDANAEWNWWNPLTDDGDALRLAKFHHFNIHWDELCKDWKIYKGSTLFAYDKDLNRSIVKAASKANKELT